MPEGVRGHYEPIQMRGTLRPVWSNVNEYFRSFDYPPELLVQA